MTSPPPTHAGPRLSVVVPMFNAPENLERCLAGLGSSTVEHELIVVDDCSTDERAIEMARSSGGRYHRLEQNSGPAVARNAGVRLASGDVVVFIDSDCVVHPRTLEQIRDVLAREPSVGALFGSYDDAPASPGIVTEYRNLLHHFVHHTGPREATTFWAGCGAVRRDAYLGVGGFDESYRRPSIEDIELGMRLRAAGVHIALHPEIQVKHLKRWHFWEMVSVDVTKRAIPWTRLLIDRPGTGGDLNLQTSQKLCVVFVFLALLSALAGVALPDLRGVFAWLWLPAALLVPVLWINRALYGLFLRHKGPLFALAGIFLHLLYFVYSGLAYLYAHLTHRWAQRESSPAT